ncbi:succinate dehydrogenase cytochrome b subunit [Nonomuraea roseoviolacea]|uniref:Succinate dehydrogenase / fumarate reductase cytochrome b subunit n=1 Tax=Nonomuraea roseoviolacea subsp. carminata TaxID=160689 RepID=A0ABT1K398_9ACTN|nr:succinate dehydrogenase cytochrome b subunit [Nonomuraea roseoviolacea]MCP2348468.1 succinate dehydrogenase / fumarate reductase cytochrome b subunit [Nonomuraea roseoviolacea subsp. carminata]
MTATIERGSATAPVSSPKSAPPAKKPTGRRPRPFMASSNGKKAVMAVTGAVMVGFLLLHMLGNLKIFLGRESFNEYAHALRTLLEPIAPYRSVLTVLEIILVVSVVLHMWAAISLARRARQARPVKYVAKKSQAGGYATHIMRFGGLTIALYVVWHLLDLTFGVVNPKGFDSAPADRMIAGFDPSRWWVTLIYLVAVVMVGLHLRHGVWSAFQTLGWANRARYKALRATASLVSAVLVVGFLAPPLAITFGVVK